MENKYTAILFKPEMINNVEDIVVCKDQKMFNSDNFVHYSKCINSAGHHS